MARTKSDSPQYVSEVPNVAVADEAALASGQELAVDNKALEKRVMWKIDRWLVLFYSIVYVVRVIDSSNYANAAIVNLENGTGIKKELGFTPSQWAWSQSIFSYSFLLFEPSNTILLKFFRPSRWMFLLIFFW